MFGLSQRVQDCRRRELEQQGTCSAEGWTEDWQCLGCREGEAAGTGRLVAASLNRSGLGWEVWWWWRCFHQDLRGLALRAWTCPGSPKMPVEPRGRQRPGGICLWRQGKGSPLPSAGAQVRSTGLQSDLLGVFFCVWLMLWPLCPWKPRGRKLRKSPGPRPASPRRSTDEARGRGLTIFPSLR